MLKYILTKYPILRTTFPLFSTFEVSVYFYVGIPFQKIPAPHPRSENTSSPKRILRTRRI